MVDINDLQESIAGEEEKATGVFGKADDLMKSFNTGLARTFGIPRAVADISSKFRDTQFEAFGIEPIETPDFLPSGEQIQEVGSRVGMTFAPGQEPDTFIARTAENFGAAAPILAALPLTLPILATEIVASPAAAAAGLYLESTEWGKKNPEIARGIGELGGGMGGAFSLPIAKFFIKNKGSIGILWKLIKRLIPGSRKRAVDSIRAREATPDVALQNIIDTEKIPEGGGLLPGQAAETPFMARLTKTVEETDAKVAILIEKRRIEVIDELTTQFRKTGDPEDARLLLEQKLAFKAEQAEKALSGVAKSADEAVLSTRAEKILTRAKVEGSKVVDDMWENLSDDITGNMPHSRQVMIEEYKNIAERGIVDEIDIKQIPFVARSKIGILNKKGKLSGGSLFRNPKAKESVLLDATGKPIQQAEEIIEKVEPSAKAIHRLYSLLGSEVEKLGRFGGQGNKIRIINRLRDSLLKDLDSIGVGGDYRKTIDITKKFHDKITKGAVGRILGRARGETPSPVTALDDIVGQGGVKAKENIQQALAASLQMKTQIQEFLKVRFAEIAVDDKTNKITTTGGKVFLKKFGKVMDDLFPELKKDFENAIAKQADVDEFLGVPTVSSLSPLMKEERAAGFYLSRNAGEEMAAVLKRTTNRTSFLSELVKTTKTDSTGKAFKGLQNSLTEEILKIGNVDDITKFSSTKMIAKLKVIKDSVLKSGLLTKDEYSKLERIALLFKKIEIEKKATAFSAREGGVISDAMSKAVSIPLRWVGARIGGQAGGSLGSGMVMAQAGSKETVAFAKRLFTDEAHALLVRFVTDKKVAKDLLTEVNKLSSVEKTKLFERILATAKSLTSEGIQRAKTAIPRPPATAIAPAAGSFATSISGEGGGVDQEEQALNNQLEALLNE